MGYVSHDAMLGIDHDWSPVIPYQRDDDSAVKKYDKWFKNLFLDPNLKETYPPRIFDINEWK